jgi:hypothetical protein
MNTAHGLSATVVPPLTLPRNRRSSWSNTGSGGKLLRLDSEGMMKSMPRDDFTPPDESKLRACLESHVADMTGPGKLPALRVSKHALKVRWLSCFDLLGFKKLINASDLMSVFFRYEKVMRALHSTAVGKPYIALAWFSDTFLIYAPDATCAGFFAVDSASHWFTTNLILREIPVRGAMSCDELYLDRSSQTYLGKGLVEAYEYGDGQDWIGFVLCPSASRRLSDLGLSPDEQPLQDVRPSPSRVRSQVRVLSRDEQLRLSVRERYVRWPVCFKSEDKNEDKPREEFLHARKLGSILGCEDDKHLVRALERMLSRETEPFITTKYTRTIEFLKGMDSPRCPSLGSTSHS